MQTLAVICPLQHDLIEAHFTLVFPMADISVEMMCEHVDQIAKRTPAIDFQLRRANAVRDSFAPRSHVFLIPNQGGPELRSLHAALYVGDLAPSLRNDIPYHPHVTVAAFETQAAAESLSQELGEFQIGGRVRNLAVVSVTTGAIMREAAIPLL